MCGLFIHLFIHYLLNIYYSPFPHGSYIYKQGDIQQISKTYYSIEDCEKGSKQPRGW